LQVKDVVVAPLVVVVVEPVEPLEELVGGV
jgi:hypothetical protein